MKTLIINGNVITPSKIINNASVLCDNGIIIDVILDAKPGILVDKIIDAQKNYISPGFIDMHVHGGGGADIMDGSVEAVIKVAQTHIKYGMTSFVPTTLTSSVEKIKKAVSSVEEAMKTGYSGARILGIHLEGPFLSKAYCGAQNPAYLLCPTIENYLNMTGRSKNILRVSMAPENEGALEFAEYLSQEGILVSVAHSDADFRMMEIALKHGFSHVSHIFNGMGGIKSPDYYCKAGVIESSLLLDEYKTEIISDGKHMPPEMLKLLYKCKGKDNMTLITDAIRAADMPEGEYELGGLTILVTDGVAMLSDRTSFAGSVATADRLVRNAVHNAGFNLVEAVNMVSINVAKQIGWDSRVGSIEKGKWSDLIVFNQNIDILHVITR
jgi:N-acetylglucosamine-6-phosphate deacetylase